MCMIPRNWARRAPPHCETPRCSAINKRLWYYIMMLLIKLLWSVLWYWYSDEFHKNWQTYDLFWQMTMAIKVKILWSCGVIVWNIRCFLIHLYYFQFVPNQNLSISVWIFMVELFYVFVSTVCPYIGRRSFPEKCVFNYEEEKEEEKKKNRRNRPFDLYGPFYLILLNLYSFFSSFYLDLETLSAYETMDESKNVSTGNG